MRLDIVAATQFEKATWQIKSPIPKIERVMIGGQAVFRQNGGIEGTQIDKIYVVGDNVEVFWRETAKPQQGKRSVLFKPTVSILTSMAREQTWKDALAELDERETVEEVQDIQDQVWRLNEDVPQQKDFVIARMGLLGDSVEVFATPKPGTAFDQKGLYIHFQLLPFFVQQIQSKMILSDWMEMQKDSHEAMLEEYSADDEPDDPDEPVEPGDLPVAEPAIAAARNIVALVPPPPSPPPNGAPTES